MAMAVLVALVALAIAYTRESKISEELKTSNRRFDDANRQLIVTNAELVEANARATKAKAESDQRLDQMLEAMEGYYTGTAREVLLGHVGPQAMTAHLLELPRRYYERLTRELEASRVPDERTIRLLTRGRQSLGSISWQVGRYDEARRQFEETIRLNRQLVAARPDVLEYQKALGDEYNNLSVAQWSLGLLGDALESQRRAIAIFTELATKKPDALDYQGGLATGYIDLGNIQRALGDMQGAAGSYLQAKSLWSNLVTTRPGDTGFQYGLASVYSNLAILKQEKEPLAALELYRESSVIRAEMVAAHPTHSKYRELLAVNYDNIANLQRSLGQNSSAAESFRQSLARWTELVSVLPESLGYRSALGRALDALGTVLRAQGNLRDAEGAFRRAIENKTVVVGRAPQVVQYQRELADSYSHLASVFRSLRRTDEAAQIARTRKSLWVKNPNELYNVACELALCVPVVQDVEEGEDLAVEAVLTLKQAIAAGWSNALHTSRDPDLAPLRDRDDFRWLLAELFDRGFPADPFAK